MIVDGAGGRVGRGGSKVGLKCLRFSVTGVVKTLLDRIKRKLNSDLQKSCREATALIFGMRSCPELLRAEDLSSHCRHTCVGVPHVICLICFGK